MADLLKRWHVLDDRWQMPAKPPDDIDLDHGVESEQEELSPNRSIRGNPILVE